MPVVEGRRALLRELLRGVGHDEADVELLAESVHLDKLVEALSDPAVRELVARYGARVDAWRAGGEGAGLVRWSLAIWTPLAVQLRVAGGRVVAVAEGHAGRAEGRSAREALEALARELREAARRMEGSYDEAMGELLARAGLGYLAPPWGSGLRARYDDTAGALERALSLPRRREEGEEGEALPA